jgi:predicted  nucleic acid-binding Zn-ribbon protein
MEQIRIAVLTPYDKVLAFLDNTVPSAMHYFDETLHTYLKGSSYTFEFTTVTAHDDAAFLVEGNKLSFTRKNKGYYLTIMNVEKGGNTTNVTAYGLCLELTNEYVDAYKAPRAMSFAEYVNAYGFEQSFVIGKNEVSDKRITHEWTGSDTVLARLYSIANVFDAELEFITQLNDDYSLKNVVLNIYRAHSDSVQGMGTDKRSTILRYPNDVYGITKTSDITELYTGIRPTGNNGLQLNSISGRVVKDSNGNILYKVQGNNILAPQSRDRFPSTLLTNHSNDMYAVLVWSYETENVETLYGQALAQLKKNCVPKVTYDVDAYIDADIGDTFTIEDAEYSPTLYLEARITEQEICFTDSEKCKTIFDNFEEKQSQISSALISEMNKMIELKKVYESSIVSSNGVLFKTDSDSTKLTALVKDDGVDITSKYSIIWYKDDVQISTNQTITISASDVSEKAVYRFKALSGEILKASAEVTVMRLQDGQNGTSAYVHIAYANSSDGRVDFSLTDSNRKFIGQYSDSKQYGSYDPTKYRWSAIKGEDGQSFVSAEEQFYYSTSQTELIGGEWFVGNVVYQSDKFLWKRWKCTYANPSEIKYTKAIFDNTWNEIDAKIGEIHTQVSQANVQSKEAVEKATQAQIDASKANELANTANTQSSEAKQLAQDANTSTGKAQEQIDAIKGDITDSKQQIQDAVDKANANASEIDTVKETYATKVDLTTESKSIHADVTTEIEKKVGELSTTVSETYASKSDLTSIEGSLNTKIKQNADSITTQASSIEKLQSDTTQAKKDITDATKKATDAQTQADKALGNAQSAQTLADQAKKKADSAQSNLDSANKELADAKANLESVTGRVDATESEITKAQTRLTNAESAVQKAQSDATKAQGNATTAINNAKAAQGVADNAKQKAEQAQKDLNALTNRVTTAETTIKQNSDSIKLQATQITDTGKKIDDLKIGGRNLLLQSGHWQSKPTWWRDNGGGLELDTTVKYNGYNTIKTVAGNGIVGNNGNFLEVDMKKTYTYSALVKVVESDFTEGNVFYPLHFQNSDTADGKTFSSDVTSISYSQNAKKGEWTLIYTTFIPKHKYIRPFVWFGSKDRTFNIAYLKLEEGNKPTDWTPAPEDVDEAINTERTERQSAIETKANEITSKVSETYVSNSALNHYKEEVSTQFSQTKSDFTWSINRSVTDAKNEMNGQISSVNGRLDGLKQTADNVNSYMSFDNDALTLGKSDSAFKTKITNQEWSIQKNGAKVTYINDQTMYITDGQFTQSLKVGAFGFVPRANGSLDFKKVG